ncbi:hypothetical protein, partial [Kibdelosporangium aridum]|uniref:hypothetical protein n=1 Tax=Kibdelosporangium aridum TaxID=2030 RepID=UPI001C8B6E59
SRGHPATPAYRESKIDRGYVVCAVDNFRIVDNWAQWILFGSELSVVLARLAIGGRRSHAA